MLFTENQSRQALWRLSLFHILIITLQAFIFMMLTLIYTGQAHDAH